ncbi:MAG: thioredoxin family protein [Spirochaetia bacterium]
MSVLSSGFLQPGTEAFGFSLPDVNNNLVALSDFKGSKALLIVFMCNHCPYVRHVIGPLRDMIEEYQKKGLAAVGINANDITTYPQDAPLHMKEWAGELRFTFPYLYDESQEVAKLYGAACTPDFFLFDEKHRLAYQGQFDASRPGNSIPVTGEDLRRAVDAVLAGKKPKGEQRPSMGCSIKWKEGNEPDYYL